MKIDWRIEVAYNFIELYKDCLVWNPKVQNIRRSSPKLPARIKRGITVDECQKTLEKVKVTTCKSRRTGSNKHAFLVLNTFIKFKYCFCNVICMYCNIYTHY
jgi:hypothetical protein